MTAPRVILITPGEPAGIGPDITLEIALHHWSASILIIADPDLLISRAKQLNKTIKIVEVQSLDEMPESQERGTLYVLPVELSGDVECGQLSTQNSQYVLDCLSIAEKLCRNKQCDALVTGPVHKGIINDAGLNFTGHTEYLAEPSNSTPVMMLATDTLRVALATTHLALRHVSDAITQKSLTSTIETLNDFLKLHCKIDKPDICVCGLNPHAGEDGHLGSEEIDVIIPVINQCLKNNIHVSQPVPADTAFMQHNLKQYDAVLAMYHDQGLPVLKHQGFGKAVNITLGLPFVRTSVDHGTALELAGTGKAKSSSLFTAINMAISLSVQPV